MRDHYIRDENKLAGLKRIALEAATGSRSDLEKADALSRYIRSHVEVVQTANGSLDWYYAYPLDTLTLHRRGNCKNYAETLIALAFTLGIDGRRLHIRGYGLGTQQGHVVTELLIGNRWVLFDAMYGAPFLGWVKRSLDGRVEAYEPRTPSALDCWRNKALYYTIMDMSLIPYPPCFWEGLWQDYSLGDTYISQLGEEEFQRRYYS